MPTGTPILDDETKQILFLSRTKEEWLKNFTKKYGFEQKDINSLIRIWNVRMYILKNYPPGTKRDIDKKVSGKTEQELLVEILNELRVIQVSLMSVEKFGKIYSDAVRSLADTRAKELEEKYKQEKGYPKP